MRRRITASLLVSLGLLMLGGVFATASAGGGCHGGSEITAPESASAVVRIENCSFGPTVTRVPAGTEVAFVNADNGPHNVVGVDAEWQSPNELRSGATFVQAFDTAGIYPYACTLHPGMNGAVVVGEADTALAATTTPAVVVAPSGEGAPMGMALAGAGGLVIGAVGAGLLLRRRDDRVA